MCKVLLMIAVIGGVALVWRLDSNRPEENQSPQVVGHKGIAPGAFFKPRAIAIDAVGRFYVVDRSGRIQYFSSTGELLHVWTTPEYANGQPVGLAVENDGTLLVNDSHYSRILRYSAGGEKLLARWGKEGKGPGEFTFGRDVVVDSEGYIYAGDYGGLNDRIQKMDRQGRFVLEWGSMGEAPGQFMRPQGMAIERSGGAEFLLVTDCANHRVQRFMLDGTFVGTIGSVGRAPGEFRFPIAIAVDRAGNYLVCEWGNNRIQKLTPEGESLGMWGEAGFAPGQLSTPWDVAIGLDDRIYVVDYGNHRVQIFRWEDGGVDASAVPARATTVPSSAQRASYPAASYRGAVLAEGGEG